MLTGLLLLLQPNGFVLAPAPSQWRPSCRVREQVLRSFERSVQFAVGSLFFLQGARLSRGALVAGAEHWRLHAAIASATFVLFPLLGMGMWAVAPHALPRSLWSGVLFVCVLPSTVQSSIALTSIARGNVPAAVCSAAGSNLAGLFLTPILFGLVSGVHGNATSLAGIH
jgi:sodium/bile acid cotransporter 7